MQSIIKNAKRLFSPNIMSTAAPGGGTPVGIFGGGTINKIPKFSAATTITDSQIIDDGTTVSIGAAPLGAAKLEIVGGALQGIYATSSIFGVNGVGTGGTSYGIKGESDTGIALRANISNITGIGLDITNTVNPISQIPLFKVYATGVINAPQLPISNIGLNVGDFYISDAATILANGDKVVGIKV